MKITVRFSAEEAALVQAAARRAGLSVSAWLGKAGTGAAVHSGASSSRAAWRDVLAELTAVNGQLGDIFPVLCRAARRLAQSGAAGPDLESAVSYVGRVAERTDHFVSDLAGRLLNDPP